LGGTESYTDYRGRNAFAGAQAGFVLLRVYRADPYLPSSEREHERRRIANAYETLSRMPPHPAIVSARDFFPTEGGEQFVLVTEDVAGQALRLHLSRPDQALTVDQKFAIAQDVLSGLAHAHTHGVIHRLLSPASILVGRDGHARLTGFDFARAG